LSDDLAVSDLQVAGDRRVPLRDLRPDRAVPDLKTLTMDAPNMSGPPDLPARLRARAASLAAALGDPRYEDGLTTLPVLPPAWCRGCRAELIEASEEIEVMREALGFVLEFVGRQSGFYRDDAVLARVVHHVETVLSGALGEATRTKEG
jgi:hypothetical protein